MCTSYSNDVHHPRGHGAYVHALTNTCCVYMVIHEGKTCTRPATAFGITRRAAFDFLTLAFLLLRHRNSQVEPVVVSTCPLVDTHCSRVKQCPNFTCVICTQGLEWTTCLSTCKKCLYFYTVLKITLPTSSALSLRRFVGM